MAKKISPNISTKNDTIIRLYTQKMIMAKISQIWMNQGEPRFMATPLKCFFSSLMA